MIDPTNTTMTIVLGGVKQKLYFDLNTFDAFEKETGKFFLDFLAGLSQAVVAAQEEGRKEGKPEGSFNISSLMRRVSLSDFRALIWAACHTYDSNDNPVWPYTIQKIGRMVDIQSMATIVPQVMLAGNANLPSTEEIGETNQEEHPTEPKAKEEKSSAPSNGGEIFGPSDEDILASMDANYRA